MEYYASLFLFTFVAGITPGPNNMMLMASGLNHGVKKSIPHYLGVCLGFPVMVAIVGFGMGGLLFKYPAIYLYLKIFGVTYLLYLAWKIANSGNQKAPEDIKKPFSFLQAAAFQWLNPKGWTIAIGALAAFSTKENILIGVISVILVYFLVGFVCGAFWLKLGQKLNRFINTQARIRYFNISMAVLLVLSVLPIVFSKIDGIS